VRRRKGDDGGCFDRALWAVRTFGGVLEHPEASHAWKWHGIKTPPKDGGWVRADDFGVTCCVEQGHYGHRARKATWLYVVGGIPSDLIWGPCVSDVRLDRGFHSAEERRAFYANSSDLGGQRKSELMDEWEEATGRKHFRRMGERELSATPIQFRDLLISIAESAK
jgi:hypothetical protein